MSSIVIAGNASGSATISAPADAGTPILTLPTTSGTIALTSDIVGVGIGQSWTSFVIGVSGRQAGTTYTNSTSKPIMVVISIAYNASNNATTVTVGSTVIVNTNGSSTGGYITQPISFIVPPNSTYLLTTANGPTNWSELR